MSLTNLEKLILEKTNKGYYSGASLVNYVHSETGTSKEEIEKLISSLASREFILQKNNKYISNPKGWNYHHSKEYTDVLTNTKAIQLILNTYNEAYYHNITFEEYFNKSLKGRVERKPVKEILLLAYRDNKIKGLPKELKPKHQQFYKRWIRYLKIHILKFRTTEEIVLNILGFLFLTALAYFFTEFLDSIF